MSLTISCHNNIRQQIGARIAVDDETDQRFQRADVAYTSAGNEFGIIDRRDGISRCSVGADFGQVDGALI